MLVDQDGHLIPNLLIDATISVGLINGPELGAGMHQKHQEGQKICLFVS